MCSAYWKLSNVQPVNLDDSTSGTAMWFKSCLCPVQDDGVTKLQLRHFFPLFPDVIFNSFLWKNTGTIKMAPNLLIALTVLL